jgi:hypothetical protein
MSVDDRDFFEEAVTSEHPMFAETDEVWRGRFTAAGVPNPRTDAYEDPEPPAFIAVGTAVTDLAGTAITDDDALLASAGWSDAEVTQPIPRMTMAELVFATKPPAKMPMLPARGVVEVKARSLALGTRELPPISSFFAELEARGEVQAPVAEPETIDELVAELEVPIEVPIEVEAAHSPDQVEMPGDVPAISRKIRPRRTRPRARTIAARRLTSIELREVTSTAALRADRPRTRAECQHEQRPCPWVSCKHHLYLDVNPRTGSIKLNFPDLEPWELEHTCALDVADDGGHTLEEVGDITNLTRERIRQLELRGLLELRGRSRALR